MLIPNHNVLSYTLRSVYPGIYLFIFWAECFPKVGTNDIMVLSDLAKGGLESGVWTDEYNYQNKDKNNITKSMSLLFFSMQCIIAKTMWFPTQLLLPSWTSSWIFQNTENNNNMPIKFSKYNHCWKL